MNPKWEIWQRKEKIKHKYKKEHTFTSCIITILTQRANVDFLISTLSQLFPMLSCSSLIFLTDSSTEKWQKFTSISCRVSISPKLDSISLRYWHRSYDKCWRLGKWLEQVIHCLTLRFFSFKNLSRGNPPSVFAHCHPKAASCSNLRSSRLCNNSPRTDISSYSNPARFKVSLLTLVGN